jgi:hypothetical protein
MRRGVIILVMLVGIVRPTLVQAQAVDPTTGDQRLFGLGGHTCKQYDDTGRLYLYSEGTPASDVVAWLQQSANGTKPNVPMPDTLAQALPLIPGCLPDKHHD